MCMWALLLLERSGKECGRGAEQQRGWFIFQIRIYEYKEKSCEQHTCQAHGAARPASSRLGRPDTKNDILQSRKIGRVRYMENSERKNSPGNVPLYIITTVRIYSFNELRDWVIPVNQNQKISKQTLKQAVSDVFS